MNNVESQLITYSTAVKLLNGVFQLRYIPNYNWKQLLNKFEGEGQNNVIDYVSQIQVIHFLPINV